MKLLITQKDRIYDLVEKSGLAPSQFEFKEQDSQYSYERATTLHLKNSEFYFSFDTELGENQGYIVKFCPASNSHTDSSHPYNWDEQIKIFKEWLSYLKREINSPNKWERLKTEIQSINLNFENDQGKFSVQEYNDLQNKIIELKLGITKIDLLEDQMNTLNIKLDQLIESAKEMNKFDWKSLFVGTIISIIIQLSVSPENTKQIWDMIKNIFNNYLLP